MSDWVVPAVAAVVGLVAGRTANLQAPRIVARRSDAAVPPAGATLTRPDAVALPWVEVGTAVLFGVVALRVGPTPVLPGWLWLAGCAVLLTIVDLRHHLLPNRVLVPATAGALVLLTAAAAVSGGWSDLVRGLLAAGALFAGLLALAMVNPAGLGLGDVKLGVLLGLYLGWLGWPAVLVGVFLAFAGQALVAAALLVTRRAGRHTQLPFGPALLGGALLVALLAGG